MDVVRLAQKLIQFKSVTPQGKKCLDFIERHLNSKGFRCNRLPFEDVDNLFASRGKGSPHILFVGHVDVVPEGLGWRHAPYEGVIENNILYGRGAVDMKGAIAAFLSAIPDNHHGTISIALTSDEEGPAKNGIAKIVPWLKENAIQPDCTLVGEPTSVSFVGDTIKNGRRGSIHFEITIKGEQGHVAYPQNAHNPATPLVHFLHVLKKTPLDKGTTDFEPSNIEIVKILLPNDTFNIIPSTATASINIRFNTLHSFASLEQHLNTIAAQIISAPFNVTVTAIPSAKPFINTDSKWVNIVKHATTNVTGKTPHISTSGGTSDARFIYKLCPVVELGLKHATAHHVDECVAIKDLEILTAVYKNLLTQI